MKRFWKEAQLLRQGDGFLVALDGRAIRTPGKALLALPNERLGEAIRREWADAPDPFAPADLPLTGLANAAIDLVHPDREAFLQPVLRYAEFDCTCFRAPEPEALRQRQDMLLEPVLTAIEQRHDIAFRRTTSLVPAAQPVATGRALHAFLAARSAFELVAIERATGLAGSIVLALALCHGLIAAEQAFALGRIDEDWERERWGDDEEALRKRAREEHAFLAAARFLALAQENG